jgi:hypothetical protein
MGGSSVFQISNSSSAAAIPFDGEEFNFWSTPICMTRMNNAAPTQTGFVVIAFSLINWPSSGPSSNLYAAYPANATPNTDSTEGITPSSGLTPAYLAAHQGRIVQNCWAGPANSGTVGAGNALVSAATDILDWTAVNQYNVGSGLTSGVVYNPEGPGGIGTMTSMNASEMFIVRRFGGGYAIRGDIYNPSIVSYPSVTPTGLDGNSGALTPNGYVYGATDGVFLWTGGDSSQSLSDNLTGLVRPRYDNAGNFQRNGPFWRDPISSIGITGAGGAAGGFYFVYPYLYAPGNWMMDFRTNGWFRLTDPSVINYNWCQPAPDGNILLAPSFAGPNQPELFSWWDPKRGTDYYTWTSQPLARTQGRLIEARYITIVAQGSGTITVNLSSPYIAPQNTDTVSFDIQSPNYPVVIQKPVQIITSDIIVNIQSSASKRNTSQWILDGSPAPRLNRLRIGYTINQTAR